jgi:single-strand DNA-binding protein
MSINRCNISGNIGRDPELRQTQGGTQVLTFSLAVSDRKRNPQSGEWEEVTNWIPCVVFGNRAESLSRFLSKGTKCAVEGKLRQSSYKDKSGQNRSKIEVIVDEVEFMSQSKAQNQPQQQQPTNYTNQYQNVAYSASQQPTGYQSDLSEEPIPF